jgi:predicted ATPase
MRLIKLELTNFRSYKHASLDFSEFVALVGLNASGKSNAIAAIKLLRDVPQYGLEYAIARQGGYDQLRHRSGGRPFEPAIAIEFQVDPSSQISRYELKLGSVSGKGYKVKSEKATIYSEELESSFTHTRGVVSGTLKQKFNDKWRPLIDESVDRSVPDGQSAISFGFQFGAYLIWELLNDIQVVEMNPTTVRRLQEPSAGTALDPTGSNIANFFASLSSGQRQKLIDALGAIVPSICDIQPRRVSNLFTIAFFQYVDGKRREFLASQMSDGTLRAFGILLAVLQDRKPQMVIIEEPEVAIHLGALRTLIEIIKVYSAGSQAVITTHSADIVDLLETNELRIIWAENGESHIAKLAFHTKSLLRDGLVSAADLIRTDALDPDLT